MGSIHPGSGLDHRRPGLASRRERAGGRAGRGGTEQRGLRRPGPGTDHDRHRAGGPPGGVAHRPGGHPGRAHPTRRPGPRDLGSRSHERAVVRRGAPDGDVGPWPRLLCRLGRRTGGHRSTAEDRGTRLAGPPLRLQSHRRPNPPATFVTSRSTSGPPTERDGATARPQASTSSRAPPVNGAGW